MSYFFYITIVTLAALIIGLSIEDNSEKKWKDSPFTMHTKKQWTKKYGNLPAQKWVIIAIIWAIAIFIGILI